MGDIFNFDVNLKQCKFCRKNAADLNIFLSHVEYGLKITELVPFKARWLAKRNKQ